MKRLEQGIIAFIFILVLLPTCFAATLTLRPDKDGQYADWTSYGCSNKQYLCVNEAKASTSDYLYTSANSAKQTVKFGSTGLSSGTVINSVTILYYAKQYNSSNNRISMLIQDGSKDYTTFNVFLGSDYGTYGRSYSINPATGKAWTVSDVDKLEAGVSSASSNGGAYLAQIYAVVSYTSSNSCTDSDGGANYNVAGTTSGYYKGVYYSHADYCSNPNTIVEYTCNQANDSYQSSSCGTDTPLGSNYCVGNSIYRSYTHYFCLNGACAANTTAILQQSCASSTQYCSAGACVSGVRADSCTDSDGGKAITAYGSTSGYHSNLFYNYSDYCQDALTVNERFCNGVSPASTSFSCGTDGYSGAAYCSGKGIYRNYLHYFCSNGACTYNTTTPVIQFCGITQYCAGGACFNGTQNNSCTDSDGGSVIGTYGYTYGYLNNGFYNNSDACTGLSTVREYFCSGTLSNVSFSSCGTSGYNSSNYCNGNSLYRNYSNYSCTAGACGHFTNVLLVQNCPTSCSSGVCH